MNPNEILLSRRKMTQAIAMASVWASISGPRVPSARAAETLAPLNRFPRMMQDNLIRQVRLAHQKSVAAKTELKTRQDAERYVAEVREKIATCMGPLPERTPLKAKTVGRLERDGYTIEKVIFESRPNFPVTANLYLPHADQPVPGVIGTCGHSSNGKAAEAYQSFSQGLARLGYACLIFDPIGQGERLQYTDENLKPRIGTGTREHLQAGNQQFLVGENLSLWRAWDGIRALDYLLTRPEIDQNHLGVTGNSGGGTMTTWLCGLERRWTMGAPACFVTTFLRNAQNELPADTEQCPPRALALGLEHEDFLLAMAPNPVTILAKEKDYFDVRGSQEAYGRMRRVYRLLGHPENVGLHIGPTNHGFTIENREAMYRWFDFASGKQRQATEPEITIEADETLWCTPSGQVAEMKPKTVADFTREKAMVLRETRPSFTSDSSGDALNQAVVDVLKIPASIKRPPAFRILRNVRSRGYPLASATTYAVQTEPQTFAISYLLTDVRHDSRPPREGTRAMLYVAHRSSDEELRSQDWLRSEIDSAVAKETTVFTCDVRGIGESLPNTCGFNTFDSPYGCDYFYAVHGVMLDRPYLGQKVWDVLRVLDWMAEYGYTQVDLVGMQWGALVATFAGLLHDSVNSVALVDRIESFEALAVDADYAMPLAYLPNGVLKHFDLPDCDQRLKSRGLWRDI